MFKLLVLSALCLCLTLAAPTDVNIFAAQPTALRTALVAEPTHVQIHEPALAKVGNVIENVPTAVSHQSSTIVHSRAQRVTPLLAPAVRSYTASALRTYAAPLLHQEQHTAPVLRSLPLGYGLGPAAAFVHAHAPLQLRSYAAAPFTSHYTAYGYPYGSSLVYAAPAFKK